MYRTCLVLYLVDKKMRKGEEFVCLQCGKPRHADENAPDTITNYLLLRSVLVRQ